MVYSKLFDLLRLFFVLFDCFSSYRILIYVLGLCFSLATANHSVSVFGLLVCLSLCLFKISGGFRIGGPIFAPLVTVRSQSGDYELLYGCTPLQGNGI